MSENTRVILDCDTANEIDDQMAIAHALGSDSLDVLAVISVQNTVASGPQSIDRYQEEAERVVELCGASQTVPCLRGASHPMETMNDAVASEGLDFIIEATKQGPLTILATGPATNMASLALLAPEVRREVNIIWAGGFPDDATWQEKKYGELNARADIASWRRLFIAEGPLKVLPGWPGVEKLAVTPNHFIQRLRDMGSPISNYIAEITFDWTSGRGVFDMDDVDVSGAKLQSPRGKVLWDIANVAAVTVPGSVHFVQEALPYVDSAGVPDWNKPGRIAGVSRDLDAEAVLEDFWKALEKLARGRKT
jgi:inosine-uridine nucleoside N-ribohydrolase